MKEKSETEIKKAKGERERDEEIDGGEIEKRGMGGIERRERVNILSVSNKKEWLY